jgi:hypothetical protein
MGLTLSMVPDTGVSIEAGAWQSDPSLVSCCNSLYDHGFLSSALIAQAAWTSEGCAACATTIGVDPVGCIPWGPPVPPSIPDAMDVA